LDGTPELIEGEDVAVDLGDQGGSGETIPESPADEGPGDLGSAEEVPDGIAVDQGGSGEVTPEVLADLVPADVPGVDAQEAQAGEDHGTTADQSSVDAAPGPSGGKGGGGCSSTAPAQGMAAGWLLLLVAGLMALRFRARRIR